MFKTANYSRLNSQHDREDLYDHFEQGNPYFDNIFIRDLKSIRHNMAHHLALITCFISYEKWMQREKYPNNTHVP